MQFIRRIQCTKTGVNAFMNLELIFRNIQGFSKWPYLTKGKTFENLINRSCNHFWVAINYLMCKLFIVLNDLWIVLTITTWSSRMSFVMKICRHRIIKYASKMFFFFCSSPMWPLNKSLTWVGSHGMENHTFEIMYSLLMPLISQHTAGHMEGSGLKE